MMTSEQTQAYYHENANARLTVLLAVCINSFLTPLSLSAILVATPAIAKSLQATAVYISWIPVVFLLSNLIALLPSGRIADIYGRKRIFLYGSIVFSIGTILVGLATTIEALLLFRILQGIGSAMIFGTGMAIITSVYKGHGRGAALGWVTASVYLGMSCGPLVGGWITDQFGWHAVFFFQIPFTFISIVMTLMKIKGEWKVTHPQALDWWGTVLLSLWIISFFLGLSNLPHWAAWLAIFASVGCAWAFIRHSERSTSPLIRLSIVWTNKVYSHSWLASALLYSGNFGLIFLLGLYLQFNLNMTPTEAGKMLMLQAIVMAILAPITGRLSDRYDGKILATIGCFVMVISCVLLLITSGFYTNIPLFAIAITFMLLGVAFGVFSTPNNSTALGAVSEERLGMASAFLNLSRLMGQALGTAIVTLLISLYIGHTEISTEHHAALASVLQWSLACSIFFATLAGYFSFKRRG